VSILDLFRYHLSGKSVLVTFLSGGGGGRLRANIDPKTKYMSTISGNIIFSESKKPTPRTSQGVGVGGISTGHLPLRGGGAYGGLRGFSGW
jgi:hypothetical protein